jgi:hypothetical protein
MITMMMLHMDCSHLSMLEGLGIMTTPHWTRQLQSRQKKYGRMVTYLRGISQPLPLSRTPLQLHPLLTSGVDGVHVLLLLATMEAPRI